MRFKSLWYGTFVLFLGVALTGCSPPVKGPDAGGTQVTGGDKGPWGNRIPPQPEEGRRIALVIGNAEYKHTTVLRGPVNDAQDVDDALRDLGYDVVRPYYNLSKVEMQKAIAEFAKELRKNDVVFFFFSGHGVQIGGKNYLIPVEAHLNTDEIDAKKLQADVETQTVAEREVSTAFSKAKVSFLALDSCRTDILPKVKKQLGSANVALKAFSPTLDSPNYGETVTFYAAKDGAPAIDGRNSVFTKFLVKALKQRLTVNQLTKQVGENVRKETQGEQKPYVYGSTEDICLADSCTGQSPPANSSQESSTPGGIIYPPPPPPPPI